MLKHLASIAVFLLSGIASIACVSPAVGAETPEPSKAAETQFAARVIAPAFAAFHSVLKDGEVLFRARRAVKVRQKQHCDHRELRANDMAERMHVTGQVRTRTSEAAAATTPGADTAGRRSKGWHCRLTHPLARAPPALCSSRGLIARRARSFSAARAAGALYARDPRVCRA